MRVEATKCHEKMMEEELVGHGRAEQSTREASGMTGDKTNPVPQSGTGQYSAGSSPPGGKQLKAGERGIFFSKNQAWERGIFVYSRRPYKSPQKGLWGVPSIGGVEGHNREIPPFRTLGCL